MRKPRLIERTKDNSRPPAPDNGQQALRAVVREALLKILSDPAAAAAAKASAGRTLLEYFSEDRSRGAMRGADMTADELDSAIADLARSRPT